MLKPAREAAGVTVAMVYDGLRLLSPNYFYLTTALICAAVSASIRSSWTVVGTIGIDLMGIALNVELDPAITAAAVLSGAYFGDTASPPSDSANLAAAVAGVDLYEPCLRNVLTSLIALARALAVFWLLGPPRQLRCRRRDGGHRACLPHYAGVIPTSCASSPWPCSRSPFTAIFLGALAGGCMAVFVAPGTVTVFSAAGETLPRWLALIKGLWLAFASGHQSNTGYAPIMSWPHAAGWPAC